VNGIIYSVDTTTKTCVVKVQDDSEYWYGIPFAANLRLMRVGAPVLIAFPESKRYRPTIIGEATVEILPKKLAIDGTTWIDDSVTIPSSPDVVLTGMKLDVERYGYPGNKIVIIDGTYRFDAVTISFPSGGKIAYNKWGANLQPTDTTVAKWGTGRFWGDIGTLVELTNGCTSGKQRIVAISIDANQVLTVTYGTATDFGTTPTAPSVGSDLLIGYVLQKGAAYGDSSAINVVLWSDIEATNATISSGHTSQNGDILCCGIIGETYRGVGGAFIGADVGDVVETKVLTLEQGTGVPMEGVRVKLEIGSASASYASIIRRPTVQWSDISGTAGPWYIQIDDLPPAGQFTLADGSGTSKRLVEVIVHRDKTGWASSGQFTYEYGYIEISS
jgi:hypothetical protein